MEDVHSTPGYLLGPTTQDLVDNIMMTPGAHHKYLVLLLQEVPGVLALSFKGPTSDLNGRHQNRSLWEDLAPNNCSLTKTDQEGTQTLGTSMTNTVLLFRPPGTCLTQKEVLPRGFQTKQLGLGRVTLPAASLGLTLSGVRRDLTPKLMQPMSPLRLGEQERLQSPPFH